MRIGESRITPAYAGKSIKNQNVFMGFQDHPRIRGEKHVARRWWGRHTGSPPHTRGKDPAGRPGRNRRGITPAYAGKRGVEKSQLVIGEDHPRIRGEKPERIMEKLMKIGSPPHTRGKENGRKIWRRWPGITPAYAGKSENHIVKMNLYRDHPRIRGEKQK